MMRHRDRAANLVVICITVISIFQYNIAYRNRLSGAQPYPSSGRVLSVDQKDESALVNGWGRSKAIYDATDQYAGYKRGNIWTNENLILFDPSLKRSPAISAGLSRVENLRVTLPVVSLSDTLLAKQPLLLFDALQKISFAYFHEEHLLKYMNFRSRKIADIGKFNLRLNVEISRRLPEIE